MATKTFNARIANKRDTSANWTSNNPVLLNGEVIIVDTEAGQVRYKVGNGTSTYTQLPFTDESLITNINGKLSLSGGAMTGNIDMGGHKLTGLGAPVNPNDAVRQADLKVVSDEVDGIIAGTTGITLAPATTTKIGGVIVGDGIEVEADGTISTNPVPDGGTEGQMLYKSADGAAWGDKPVMYVNITMTSGTAGTSDKTSPEINDAVEKGYAVYANLEDAVVIPLASKGQIVSVFPVSTNNGSRAGITTLTVDALGSVSAVETELAVLDSDGKIPYAQLPDMDYVPTSRTVNGKALSQDISLAASDVGARPDTWTPSAADVGALPTQTGTQGQLLGFTADNTVGAVDAPESGLTQEQADERYLQLSGGAMTGPIYLNAVDSPKSILSIRGTSNAQSIVRVQTNREATLFYFQSVAPYLNGSIVIVPGSNNPDDPCRINNIAAPVSNTDAANKAYVDSKAPTSVAVTLTTSGWSSNTQTVTVSGVVASETAQLITPTPAIASQSAYYEAGIMCTNQAANSLTFTCQTVPTSNLTVYVVIQPLG